MSERFNVACIQNRATADMTATIEDGVDRCRRAQREGADLICLPEYFSCLDVEGQNYELGAHAETSHPALATFCALAGELNAWILLGSLAIRSGDGRIVNRSYMLDATGRVVARYDKIHLFDVDLADGESYCESASVTPGASAVLAPTPWGLLGMTVCYDLRFAHLYRVLAKAGALFLSVPAAFTRTTGEAHWHVLNRARAIETGSYVFAPCQTGLHGEAETYGHSLIIDPWGRVLADGGVETGVVMAEVDPSEVAKARAMIPALRHDRPYAEPDTVAIGAASAE